MKVKKDTRRPGNKCDLCGAECKDQIIDAPMIGMGKWAHMCERCGSEYAHGSGTVFVKVEKVEPKGILSNSELMVRLRAEYGGEDGILDALMEDDSIGICAGCGNIQAAEPDATANYCDVCESPNVKSALILLGVI